MLVNMSRDHVMYNKQTQIPSLKLYPLLREDNSRTNARVKVYSHHSPIFKTRLAPHFNPDILFMIFMPINRSKKKTHFL